MRNFALGILVGLGLGVLAGGYVGAPRLTEPISKLTTGNDATAPEGESEEAAERAANASGGANSAKEVETRTLRVIGTFPRAQPGLQPVFDNLESGLRRVTGGRLAMVYYEPGTVPEQNDILKAVASGKVAAGLAEPGTFAAKEPALYLYGGFPFGPDASELLAWYQSEGHKFMANAFTRLKVKALACGLRPPQGGGWFREAPSALTVFKDRVLAMDGLGGEVLERLEAHPMTLDAAGVFSALENGLIYGAFLGDPASDANLSIARPTGVLMLPGWQKQAGFVTLIINPKVWESIGAADQRRIEGICAEALGASLADGEAAQFGALAQLQADGAVIRRWPQDMLAQFKAVWRQVARDHAQGDNEFSLAWSSLNGFRARYENWRALGYAE